MSITTAYIGIILIWSTTPLAIKWSGEEAGFLFGVTARMLIGTFICLLIMAFMRIKLTWNKKAIQSYLAASMGIFGSMLLTYWGAQFITSGMLSVLFGFTPLLTGILAAWVLKERSLTASKITGVAFGITGLIAVFYTDIAQADQAIPGILAVLMATTLHSLSTVTIKKINCHLPGLVINAGSLIISSILFLIVWVFSDAQLPENISLKSGISILYLGVLGNVVGFTLYFYALKNMAANKIGMIPLITPVIALTLGYIFNQEPLGWKLILGSGLILLGLVIHQWGNKIKF